MPSTSFEVKHRDGLARIGRFTTPHGTVTTPTLLPVINPSTMPVPVETMRSIGARMVITNSYIIHNNNILREKALEKGVHSLIGDLPIMTDSGTFQMYVYGRVRVTNEEIIEFQRRIGSDVGTILDVFTIPETDQDQARIEAEETLKRAEKGASLKGEMALAGTVQGGIHPELREWHARELSKLDLDFHPVGGVVPLMENGRYHTLVEIIMAAKKGLIPSRPVHLFGAGHPIVFPLAAYLGCDFFDSASYIKYAKDDRMMFPNGTRKLKDIHELGCCCPICSTSTPEDLRSLPEEERVRNLAIHNLHVSFAEIRRVRNAIRYGDLRELVESRLRENPELLPVFELLEKEKTHLEKFEPITRRSAFYYTGSESLFRPNVTRYLGRFHSRFMRSRRNDERIIVLLEENDKPYSRVYADVIRQVREIVDARFFVNSVFGPVPIELDEMYPIAQSVIPKRLEARTVEIMRKTMESFSHSLPPGLGIIWDGEGTLEFLRMVAGDRKYVMDKETDGQAGESQWKKDMERDGELSREKDIELDRKREGERDKERIMAVADIQFGEGARNIFHGELQVVKSRRTGKIRNILVDGEHVVSMRAHDGLFTLKPPGARRLMIQFPSPELRVIVQDDAAEFISEGKNVFAKFVIEMDPGLRPMDETIVVDSEDRLLGIGQVVLIREEAKAFQRGIAVKVRDGVRAETSSN